MAADPNVGDRRTGRLATQPTEPGQHEAGVVLRARLLRPQCVTAMGMEEKRLAETCLRITRRRRGEQLAAFIGLVEGAEVEEGATKTALMAGRRSAGRRSRSNRFAGDRQKGRRQKGA